MGNVCLRVVQHGQQPPHQQTHGESPSLCITAVPRGKKKITACSKPRRTTVHSPSHLPPPRLSKKKKSKKIPPPKKNFTKTAEVSVAPYSLVPRSQVPRAHLVLVLSSFVRRPSRSRSWFLGPGSGSWGVVQLAVFFPE